MDAKEWEDLFKYAESNIVGYKRPADYMERVRRVLNGECKRAPAHSNINWEHHHEDDIL